MKKNFLKSLLMLVLLSGSTQLVHADSPQETDKKSAIIIVGTGRCGSSCVAGVLDIMGVEFGNNLTKANQYNPKGYFEDKGTGLMTRDILKDEFDMNFWVSPQIIKWDQVANREGLKNRIKEYLKEHFSKYPIFAVKNSFLSFLIPLYAQAVIELGYTPKILVPIRDPYEVAHSWLNHAYHGQASLEQLYVMISKCLMSILEHSTTYDTLLVDFDELINNTRTVVGELNNFIPGLKNYELVNKELESFIDKNLKNF